MRTCINTQNTVWNLIMKRSFIRSEYSVWVIQHLIVCKTWAVKSQSELKQSNYLESCSVPSYPRPGPVPPTLTESSEREVRAGHWRLESWELQLGWSHPPTQTGVTKAQWQRQLEPPTLLWSGQLSTMCGCWTTERDRPWENLPTEKIWDSVSRVSAYGSWPGNCCQDSCFVWECWQFTKNLSGHSPVVFRFLMFP